MLAAHGSTINILHTLTPLGKFSVGVQGTTGINAVFSQGKRLCTIFPLHSNRKFALGVAMAGANEFDPYKD